MTTKRNVPFIFAIIGALCIGFVVGISVNYPMPDKSLLGGTVGKAKKYHKTSMTASDIKLRSELLSDTVMLHSMIREMVYFSLLTEQVSKSLDFSRLAFEVRGMGSTATEKGQLTVLKDYSEFIRNNNKALNSTIALLTGISTGDTVDLSMDVEKNFRDFGAYVTNLSDKNDALNQAVTLMDNFMLNNEILKTHKSDLAELKSIRDQLVITATEMIGLVFSKEQLGQFVNLALLSEEKLGRILNVDQLNLIAGQQRLDLGAVSQSQTCMKSGLGVLFSTTEYALVYNTGSNQVIIMDKAGLQVAAASEKLQVIALLGKDKLNVVMSNCSLQLFSQSDVYQVIVANRDLGRLFAISNTENIFNRGVGFTMAIGFVASHNLLDRSINAL